MSMIRKTFLHYMGKFIFFIILVIYRSACSLKQAEVWSVFFYVNNFLFLGQAVLLSMLFFTCEEYLACACMIDHHKFGSVFASMSQTRQNKYLLLLHAYISFTLTLDGWNLNHMRACSKPTISYMNITTPTYSGTTSHNISIRTHSWSCLGQTDCTRLHGCCQQLQWSLVTAGCSQSSCLARYTLYEQYSATYSNSEHFSRHSSSQLFFSAACQFCQLQLFD